jgi:DNA-directed RNA polymerase specialized sigma24 family protein
MGDQQIIYLRFFLEIPVHETAAVLDIAEGTVKSRLHRALDHLRTIIDRRYPALKEGRSE